MTPSAFDELQRDLEAHLKQSLESFFAERSIAYDHQAYMEQFAGNYGQAVREVIYLGADQFPLSDDGDESVAPQAKLPESLTRLLEMPNMKIGVGAR